MYAKLVLCGDFNELDKKGLQDQLHLSQLNFPTHGQNTLDLILTDMADQYFQQRPLHHVSRSPHLLGLWAQALASSTHQQSHVKTY